MSRSWRPKKAITFKDLFDGRLEGLGICEKIVEGTTYSEMRCLTDGSDYMWVTGSGTVTSITRYGMNDPNNILTVISEVFNTDYFTEEDYQYWGFETEKEMENWQREARKESDTQLYIDIMKFVKGEPNNIIPSTIGMKMANIAKDLIEQNPKLASLDHEADLMESIDEEYYRE